MEKYYHPNNNKAPLVDFDFDGPRLPLTAYVCPSEATIMAAKGVVLKVVYVAPINFSPMVRFMYAITLMHRL